MRKVTLVLLLLAASLIPAAPAHAAPPPGPPVTFGDNDYGELGDGTTTDRSVPGYVCATGTTAPCSQLISQATTLALGHDFTVALLADGSVLSWGHNVVGQLGDGTTTNRSTPVRVCAVGQAAPCTSFLTGVTAITAGANHAVALLADGTLVSWGQGTDYQLGDGGTTNRLTPVRVCAVGQAAPCTSFLTGVTAVEAGQLHNVALLSNSSVVAWGYNTVGQVGDGTTALRSVPVRVCAVGQTAPCTSFLTGVTGLAGGYAHSVALMSDGTATSWGYNLIGSLGDGTTTNKSIPGRVCAVGATAPCTSFLSGIDTIVSSGFHTLALLSGDVYGWGSDSLGQLGDGATTSSRTTPVRTCALGQTAPCASFLTGVTALAAGNFHSLALLSDDTVLSWGENRTGRLGDGTTAVFRSTPGRVCAVGQTAPCTSYLDRVTAIAAGSDHSAALRQPVADLAVGLTAQSTLLSPVITYTVTATNNGPSPVTAGTIRLTVPPTTAAATSATCTYNAAARQATCPVGALAAGATSTHTVNATIGVLSIGTLTATATRTASTPPDQQPANDTDTAQCTVLLGLIILC